MPTVARPRASLPKRRSTEPRRLKNWDEAEVLFKKYLKAADHGPKGQPIYAQSDVVALIERLNIRLPEEFF